MESSNSGTAYGNKVCITGCIKLEKRTPEIVFMDTEY